jgi:3-hydroxy-9,10-secoandrosta-1,3,5(10)-triene-9,17-dione monooxygenase reductase component
MSSRRPDGSNDASAVSPTEEFRRVLSHYPTGVVVVTGATPGGPVGLAVGSFTSVSLEPRMVGFFVDLGSTSWPPIRATGRFAINVLASDQRDVCSAFARSGGDKFEGCKWHPAASGSPILDGVVAWIDCELERAAETGDHWFVLGRVIELASERDQHPLIFHRGAFPGLSLP